MKVTFHCFYQCYIDYDVQALFSLIKNHVKQLQEPQILLAVQIRR